MNNLKKRKSNLDKCKHHSFDELKKSKIIKQSISVENTSFDSIINTGQTKCAKEKVDCIFDFSTTQEDFNNRLHSNAKSRLSTAKTATKLLFETVYSIEKITESKSNQNRSKMCENFNKNVRVLTLNANEHQDTTLYILKKDWILQFRVGPSLFGQKIRLYCNYPSDNKTYDRNEYNLIKWQQEGGSKNADDTASYAEIVVKIAGSFHYYFKFENE